MKAQAVAFDQPCYSAYEQFIEITNHLRGEALSAGTHSVRWAAPRSGGFTSHWCSDMEHHIQKRG